MKYCAVASFRNLQQRLRHGKRGDGVGRHAYEVLDLAPSRGLFFTLRDKFDLFQEMKDQEARPAD